MALGTQGQFIIVEGWDIEFLAPGTPLVEEALQQAVERDVNGVSTRVFTAEHLAAICLQVGRRKDDLLEDSTKRCRIGSAARLTASTSIRRTPTDG